jgi:putative ABC transport system permease protein
MQVTVGSDPSYSFAAVALVVAAAGLYSLLAYLAAGSRRE